MMPARNSDPLLPCMSVAGAELLLPPAEAVVFVLRTIESALANALGDGLAPSPARKPRIPFPSGRKRRYRLLTLREAQLRMAAISRIPKSSSTWAKEVADELYRETRQEGRARKEAPVLKRLTGFVRKVVTDNDGQWSTLPPIASIARTLQVSRRAVQEALNRLRETSSEFAFHSEARLDSTSQGNRRGRCVRAAFTSWLEYDQKPLLFDRDGKERGIRTSFRPDHEVLKPDHPVNSAARKSARDEVPETVVVEEPDRIDPITVKEEPTKCTNCLSDSIRLDEPAVFYRSSDFTPKTHFQFSRSAGPAAPEVKIFDKQRRLSWALARELRRDHFGDWDDKTLRHHRWRFELPLFVIRSMVAEAQQKGVEGPKIKSLFDSACYETNAAVFDGMAKNPGGLFRSVFRRRCTGTGARDFWNDLRTLAKFDQCGPVFTMPNSR
jgi:hypothetical protein